ncbi:MAG: hypothetical protein KDC38_08835, partial [Planctomycetes bacterium]|nr:hypothetical protein [Planctomycetota bacterium]
MIFEREPWQCGGALLLMGIDRAAPRRTNGRQYEAASALGKLPPLARSSSASVRVNAVVPESRGKGNGD